MKAVYWVVAVVVVIAAAALTIKMLRNSRREGSKTTGGFRDWLKDPSYRHAVEAESERQARLEPPADIDRAGIDALVRQLLDKARSGDARVVLEKLGEKAVPSLVAALKDERFWGGKAAGGDAGAGAAADPALQPAPPAEEVLSLLEDFAPADAVPPLAARVSHPAKSVRQVGALALGANGGDGAAGPLKTVLADNEDYVRSWAMIGVGRALRGGRATPAFKAAAFEAIVPLLDREDRSASGDPPVLLLRLDRERAVPLLLGDRFFRVENRNLWHTIAALTEAAIKIPPQRLRPVMDAAKAHLGDERPYPHDYVYGESLRALARAEGAAAEPTIRAALDSAHVEVFENAAQALALLRGVEDASGHVFRRIDAVGYEGLTAAQRAYYCAKVLDNEVRNGGFLQYFVNSSGDQAREAPAALRTVGAAQTAKLVEQALSVFGRQGPAGDREERHAQVSKLTQVAESMFSGLETTFYQDPDRLRVKLQLFAAEHAEDFKDGAGAPGTK